MHGRKDESAQNDDDDDDGGDDENEVNASHDGDDKIDMVDT